jgi:uncharacterized membrane protein YfcA
MSDPKLLLLLVLALVGIVYLTSWIRDLRRAVVGGVTPTPLQSVIGFVTNFFDTLGIGSFAPTTALFRMLRIVPDERIPGTLNVGHSLPTIAQAFIYIVIINVDIVTLASLIAASIVGAWLGAGIVGRWPRRKIQLAPGGGVALSLRGPALVAGIVGNFFLGALMTLGIGLYAPCLIMISLLGMDPKAAFPIMMGSCAFLMPVASIRFIREHAYDVRPSIGLAIAGIPAVLIAAYIVRSLPLTAVRWLVMIVVLYTAATMLATARRERRLLATPVLP